MDQRKMNELLQAAKKGDYSKLEEVKDMISEEDYAKALNMFNKYAQKSEAELIKELSRLKHLVPNQQQMIETIKPFLTQEQLAKLDRVLEALEEE